MNHDKYIGDLQEIKEMMNRSSRFISLSGWSGISAGLIALIGAYLSYNVIYVNRSSPEAHFLWTDNSSIVLLLIAIGTLICSIGAGIYFTTRETRRRSLRIWDYQTKRLLINLAIPLAAGGIFCLTMLFQGYVVLVIPLTLIFYGLALVNASKYTLPDIRTLGLIEIGLGLIATYIIEYGLLFWAIGFGVMHIVYGIIMQVKDKS